MGDLADPHGVGLSDHGLERKQLHQSLAGHQQDGPGGLRADLPESGASTGSDGCGACQDGQPAAPKGWFMAVPLKPMSMAADMREEVIETLLSYLEVCPEPFCPKRA